ncbi:MAG: bifunctional nuclease family protein [Candidatus Margulisbacteria bacterium]|nr:bifunctional nuclease family protein [Candidatus Margulisiibacteriota bacterium]
MIELQISGLGFDPKNMSPMVLLRDTADINFLPIWIGIFEAASIAMEMQGVKPPRPMTHDLLKTAIEKMGGIFQRILISEIRDGTFFANIEVEKDGKKLSFDARPSDAIALAVRTRMPIMVSEQVMMQAKLVNAEKDEEETRKFKDFINNMRPEDFTKFYGQGFGQG